jgi:Tol biopolymer transport system component
VRGTTRVRGRRLLAFAVVSAVAVASAAPAAGDGRDQQIAFQSGRGLDPATNLQRIYSMQRDGSNVQPLLPERFDNSFDVAWSPDGGRFAFTSILDPGYFEIHVARADGTRIQRITETGDVHDGGPAWFPGGDKLAFVSDRVESDPSAFGQFDIYVTRLRPPFDLFNVTNNPGNDCGCYEPAFIFAAPSVSPDGKHIAFTSDVAKRGNFDVYVIKRDGTRLRRLTTGPGIDAEPDWSPDGRTIAFNSDRDGDAELYVMRRDGSGVTQVTRNNAVQDIQPDWSPDGRKFAFTSDASGNSDIWVIEPDGEDARQLTAHPAVDERPAWQPRRGDQPDQDLDEDG